MRARVSMDEVFCVTTSFLAVYLLFQLAPFAKNLLKEDEELFVLLTALRSAGHRFILATQL